MAWNFETIKMAFVATLIGFVIAIPLSSFAANNLAPVPVAITQGLSLQVYVVFQV